MIRTSIRSGSATRPADDLLPCQGLPASGYPANARLQWFSTDSAEHFATHAPPGFGAADIEYDFNASGYRCPSFAPVDGLRVLAIGCSYVFGVGLPAADLFAALVTARLESELSRPATLWNLGLPGTSNDYIARLLHLAVPALDPHVVLVNFTHADRREYASDTGVLMPFCAGWYPEDRIGRDVKEHLSALASPADDDLNLYRNYKSVESLLAGRFWLYSTIAHPLRHATAEESRWGPLVRIRHHVDPARYAGTLDRLDLARDGCHPGRASHRELATRYWARCLDLDGTDVLRG